MGKSVTLHEESYAADKQDVYLRDFLFKNKKKGYFIDCGSADGLYKSNTFLLERDLGWDGICIEGRGEGELSYEQCKDNRSVQCFNHILSGGDEDVYFEFNNTGSKITDGGANSKKLRARGLHSILKEANAPKNIDLLHLDIEGAEERVLINFPFDEYNIKVVCVERPSQLLIDHLLSLEYTRHRTINNWPDNTGYAFADNNDHLYVKGEI